MTDLAKKQCVPCQGGTPPLSKQETDKLLGELDGWEIRKAHHLCKDYDLPDFKSALDLVNRIGDVAEAEGHHPDVFLSYGKVGIELWTHKIDGLTESDFIMAAKIDQFANQA